ncbi:hypothetical protein BaRGS_00039262 [Batillaria attramentaria]|uniref:Uncharacterized protein n=1 Tax=Batillaria attramentaria TaxID=370345 RepID=A0ABD0J3G6_9CAEN
MEVANLPSEDESSGSVSKRLLQGRPLPAILVDNQPSSRYPNFRPHQRRSSMKGSLKDRDTPCDSGVLFSSPEGDPPNHMSMTSKSSVQSGSKFTGSSRTKKKKRPPGNQVSSTSSGVSSGRASEMLHHKPPHRSDETPITCVTVGRVLNSGIDLPWSPGLFTDKQLAVAYHAHHENRLHGAKQQVQRHITMLLGHVFIKLTTAAGLSNCAQSSSSGSQPKVHCPCGDPDGLGLWTWDSSHSYTDQISIRTTVSNRGFYCQRGAIGQAIAKGFQGDRLVCNYRVSAFCGSCQGSTGIHYISVNHSWSWSECILEV